MSLTYTIYLWTCQSHISWLSAVPRAEACITFDIRYLPSFYRVRYTLAWALRAPTFARAITLLTSDGRNPCQAYLRSFSYSRHSA